MSASKTGSPDSMEGWSIVRHRTRDDIGSDGDSVEVLSEDSDRDTSSEDGKDSCDDEIAPDPDTTTADDAGALNDGQDERDLDSELVALDPLGDLAQRLSNKLQELVLLPGGVSNDPSGQEMKLRYVVIASALLALICSLLVSSYLLFLKVKAIPEEKQDYSSAHVLQELDQVISKLQTVLQLENEQHLRDILSKMPPNYLSLDKLMVQDDVLQNRKVPVQSSDVRVGSIGSVDETGPTREVFLKSTQGSEDGVAHIHEVAQSTTIQDPSQSTPIEALSQSTPIQNLSLSALSVSSSADDLSRPEKKISIETETTSQNQAGPKANPNQPLPVDPIQKGSAEKAAPGSDLEAILLSVRQDVLSIQKQIYTQIMNSLFEYKIDLYKNLLRSGVDVSCAGEPVRKANHKNFMFIRNLQQMIAKSSEANFESWYKFYSFSILPKMRDIVGVLDSITAQGVKGEWDLKVEDDQGEDSNSKDDAKGVTDDFFVRAALPNVESDSEAMNVAKDGFDWKNLDQKIRESLNLKRHGKHRDRVGREPEVGHDKKRLKKDSRKNYVELRKGAETGDFGSEDDRDSEDLKYSHRSKRQEKDQERRHYKKPDHKDRRYSKVMEDKLMKKDDQKHKSEREAGKDESSRGGKKRERKEETRKFQVKDEEKLDERWNWNDGRQFEDKKKYERKHEDKDDGKKFEERRDGEKDKGKYEDKKKREERHMDQEDRKYEDKKKHEKSHMDKEERTYKDQKKDEERHLDKEERKYENKQKHEERHLNKEERKYEDKKMHEERRKGKEEKYEGRKRQQDQNCDVRGCKARGRRDAHDRRGKRKSFLSNVTKYVKTAASGLWETVEKGFKKVKHYGEAVKSSMKSTTSEDQTGFHSDQYEEWRKEFVKELKDLIRVLGGNPTINSLYEMPKSMTQFFGQGLSKVLTPAEDWHEEENVKGPEGVRGEDHSNTDEGYSDGGEIPATWYVEAAKHRAEARGTYPSKSDRSWFLGLGRHRSYLRRRGIHLDDDGSWFISSAKHRAKMRQRHTDPTQPQPLFQASSKR